MVRKLGKRTDQRMHMLRNQVSELLWYGRIETTEDRAKEVKKLAEKMVTLGIRTYKDVVTTTKTKTNAKGEKVAVEFKNDGKSKLNARRKMMSFLRDIKETQGEKESKTAFKERTRDIKHPLIEKVFNEYAPKYDGRREELGQGGGYTRILKLGQRRGDAAEMVIIEMV